METMIVNNPNDNNFNAWAEESDCFMCHPQDEKGKGGNGLCERHGLDLLSLSASRRQKSGDRFSFSSEQ